MIIIFFNQWYCLSILIWLSNVVFIQLTFFFMIYIFKLNSNMIKGWFSIKALRFYYIFTKIVYLSHLLSVHPRLTPTHIGMMKCITSHLANKSWVVIFVFDLLSGTKFVVIKNIFKQFALNGLWTVIWLHYLISCFNSSHVFKLLNYFETRRLITIRLFNLYIRWLVQYIFNCHKLLLWFFGRLHFTLCKSHFRLYVIRIFNWLILFSLFWFLLFLLLEVIWQMLFLSPSHFLWIIL